MKRGSRQFNQKSEQDEEVHFSDKNLDYSKISNTGGILFIPDWAVEEVSHVFRAAFYS